MHQQVFLLLMHPSLHDNSHLAANGKTGKRKDGLQCCTGNGHTGKRKDLGKMIAMAMRM
jgi:hypothetical protein